MAPAATGAYCQVAQLRKFATSAHRLVRSLEPRETWEGRYLPGVEFRFQKY